MGRPRVLIVAEAANPDWVSVPLVGWSLARALGEVADTHLVTQVRNRDAILATGMAEGRDVTFIDSEALARPLWKLGSLLRMGEGKGWTALQAVSALSYPYFERLVWRRFGRDIESGRYDIVHRITPLSPTQTGSLARRCKGEGVPFVMGPMNGGVPWPKEFAAARRQEREWLSYVRGLYRLMPGNRRMIDASAAILAGSRHTAGEYAERAADRVIWLPENGIDPARFDLAPRPAAIEGPPRACFIGRMVPYKGPDMLMDAAAPLVRDGRLALDLIGDGPMMEDLRARAADLGPGVTLHGWLPHAEVQSVAARSQVLAFPSVREFGGGVVLEAMAIGLMPMIVDYAGPGELVTEANGVKIPMGDRDAIVAGFRAALNAFVEAPRAAREKGAAAQAVVRQNFTWAAKARQVSRVYDHVLGSGAKPDFTEIVKTSEQEARDAAV